MSITDYLPGELLAQIVSDQTLQLTDLVKIALVNRRFNDVASARLYRTGEIWYVGAEEKDVRKTEAFSRNGQYVRNLKFQLFPRWGSNIDIPTKIWEIIRNFVNLHELTFIDSGSLSWDDFTCVLAHIITAHPHLKSLEIQRTFLLSDGRESIDRARTLVNGEGKTFCKLNSFALKLSKKEDPKLLSRRALNDLIEILGKSTRSATSFVYAAECMESPHVDASQDGKEPEALSWEWDNLEDLILKPQWIKPYYVTGSVNSYGTQKWSIGKDLQNVKSLTIRGGIQDFESHGDAVFNGGIQTLTKLEKLRIGSPAGHLTWNPKLNPNNPITKLAEKLQHLRIFEIADPFYMTYVMQAFEIIRTDDGDITYKTIAIK